MSKMIAAVTLVSAAFPAAAMAQTADRQILVSYHDLDLRRAADVQQLDRRLEIAIGTACSGEDSRDWQRQLATKRCRAAKQQEVAPSRTLALAKAAKAEIKVATR